MDLVTFLSPQQQFSNPFIFVFSVDLVFQEKLNILLEILDFYSRCGGLKLRGTDSLPMILDLQRLMA